MNFGLHAHKIILYYNVYTRCAHNKMACYCITAAVRLESAVGREKGAHCRWDIDTRSSSNIKYTNNNMITDTHIPEEWASSPPPSLPKSLACTHTHARTPVCVRMCTIKLYVCVREPPEWKPIVQTGRRTNTRRHSIARTLLYKQISFCLVWQRHYHCLDSVVLGRKS